MLSRMITWSGQQMPYALFFLFKTSPLIFVFFVLIAFYYISIIFCIHFLIFGSTVFLSMRSHAI